MFQSARFKLAAWYLVIIMLISIVFSMVIYLVINEDYNRLERVQRLRHREAQEINLLPEVRERLQIILFLVNLGILSISALAGYFLAGRTLRPIKDMVDEQNRFITDASHELRTPLTSLKSEIEVNLRDQNLSLKDAKKLLESNLEDVNSLQYLSDNLIKITQYQKSKGVNFEEISLSEVVEEAVKKASNLAKHKNISIINHVKNSNIEGEKQSLNELFVILLDNAIKYSPKNKKITLSTKALDHLVEIIVKDEGIGIEKEEIPHLFDRFYRVDKSRTKNNTDGYGLGLSIAQQIVQKHLGSIKVESEIGKGSVFIITLPVKDKKSF